jgi:hypothetical protein
VRVTNSHCRPEGSSVTGDGLIQITEYIGQKSADRAGLHLTPKEQKRNIISIATSHRE